MKVLKKLFKFIAYFALFLLIVLLALPLWIGPVVKGVANSQVPKITGTAFNLGEFGLNPYTGRLHAGEMRLQNPERFFKPSEKSAKSISEVKGDGILGTAIAHAGNVAAMAGDAAGAVLDAVLSSETNAVALGSLDVSFSTMSAFSDTIQIQEIAIRDLYFYGDLTFSNIREIADNATRGGDGEGSVAKVDGAGSANDAQGAAPEAAAGEGGKKVVIDRVIVTGAKIQWGHVAVPLPDIEIKDIGKQENGASEEGAFDAIIDGICDAADKVCAGAGHALKIAIEGADSVKGAVGSAASAVGDAAGAAFDAGKSALGGAADLGKGAASAVGDAAGVAFDAGKSALGGAVDLGKGAAEGVGSAAGAAFDAGKSALGGAVDLGKGAVQGVGGAVGGAVDAVKGMFK